MINYDHSFDINIKLVKWVINCQKPIRLIYWW